MFEIEVSAGLVSSYALREAAVLCSSPKFWWLFVILGVPWLEHMSLNSLPPSSCDILSVSLNLSLLIRTPVIGFRAHSNPVQPHHFIILIFYFIKASYFVLKCNRLTLL